jgi:spore coat polysaccharide biosynthesis protein SpsF (cytidylyltransferase family)
MDNKMKKNTLDSNDNLSDGIIFYQFIEDLINKKYIIIIITLIFTLIAGYYSLSIKPLYRAEALISATDDTSISVLRSFSPVYENKNGVTKNDLLGRFLESLLSEKVQKSVFLSNSLTKELIKDSYSKYDVNYIFRAFVGSTEVHVDKSSIGKKIYIPEHVIVTMTGDNPRAISSYLNDLLYASLKDSLTSYLNSKRFEINTLIHSENVKLSILKKHSKSVRNVIDEEMKEILEIIVTENVGESNKFLTVFKKSQEEFKAAFALDREIDELSWFVKGLEDKLTNNIEFIRTATINKVSFPNHTPVNLISYKLTLSGFIAGFLLSIIFVLLQGAYIRYRP